MKIVSSLLKLRSGSDQNPYPSKNECAPDSVESRATLCSHILEAFGRRNRFVGWGAH
jgi:hypothetical protein